jgi:hypothetical protein
VNPFDSLVEWASEVGAGSWSAWREACGYLRVEPTGAAQRLSALGHVEFDWVDDRFAVSPPTAVLTFHSSGCLLLTGARRRDARERLDRLNDQGDYDIDLRPPIPQEDGPETWLIEAELDDVERFCVAAGLGLEIDSGRRIAEALPRASLDSCAEEGRPDPRFPRKWIDPTLGRPGRNVPGSTDGLWWVEEYRRDVAFVRRDGVWFRVPTREYGPYLAYPDHPFITYSREAARLAVDYQAPLPPLLARAATLQSGRLPKRDTSRSYRHVYVNIDEQLVELIQDRLTANVLWTQDWS